MFQSSILLEAPEPANICAVIVTFFPDSTFSERVSRTLEQVAHVVMVDNGSDMQTYRHVRQALSHPNTDVIRNSTNSGIATALNQGVQWALAKGYEWVLLLDQDTMPYSHMVRVLAQAYAEFPEKDELALIGSNCYPNSPSKGSQSIKSGWWTISKMVITSGTLLRLDAARLIGPFRDEFFIDCVDLEFCLRARAKGFKIIEILEPIMDHDIGNPRTVRLLWFKTTTYNHSPWRSYYEIRNFVIVVRENLARDPYWALWFIYVAMKAIPLRLLIEKSRTQKLGYMMLGLYDGIVKRFDRAVGGARQNAMSGRARAG